MKKSMVRIVGSYAAAAILFLPSCPATAQEMKTGGATTVDPIEAGIQQALQTEREELERQKAEANVMAEQKAYAEKHIYPALETLKNEINKRIKNGNVGLIYRGNGSAIGEYVVRTNIPDHICRGEPGLGRDTLEITIKKDSENKPDGMRISLPCFSYTSNEWPVVGKYDVLMNVAEQAMLYRDNLYSYRENEGFIDLKSKKKEEAIKNYWDSIRRSNSQKCPSLI